jgi:hypothetical protein
VRLTGPEEPGHPDAIGSFIVVVGVQKGLKPFLNLVGEYIFFYFKAKARFIISFDDSFYWAINRFIENCLKSHHVSFVYASQ